VFIPRGEPVQLAAPVRAQVFYFENGKKQGPVSATLPAGHYVLEDGGK